MNVQNQIHRLKNILAKGYTMRPTVTGGSYIQRRANDTSIIHRTKEKVMLTPGRRRMIELKIKQLKGCEKFLWISAALETVNKEIGGQIVTRTIIKKVRSTYSYSNHGPLKTEKR